MSPDVRQLGVVAGIDLMGIVRARTLSYTVMRYVRQYLVLSFAYNVAGIPLAVGALCRRFGLLLSSVVAVAAIALSAVSVIANAPWLRAVKSSCSALS